MNKIKTVEGKAKHWIITKRGPMPLCKSKEKEYIACID